MTNAEPARPRRILALDGGGTRGVVALAFLERLEKKLAVEAGRPVALADHFDLIGGTSTGAIIATALALGNSVEEVKALYFELGPTVFRSAWYRGMYISALFDTKILRRKFEGVVGRHCLDSPDLRCRLAIITKRVDTGSVWFLTNNENAPYWNDRAPPDPLRGNRHYPLVDLLIASTAAPTYFAPLLLQVNLGELPGTFIDGGVSPYNDPSLALFMMATIPAYGFGWPVGEHALDITSVGTGTYRYRMKRHPILSRIAGVFASQCLLSVLSDTAVQTVTLMQALGRNETRWWINSEIKDLAGVSIAGQPLFTYRRYNLVLETDWLKREADTDVTDTELEGWRRLDRARHMQALYEAAAKAAERQIGGGG